MYKRQFDPQHRRGQHEEQGHAVLAVGIAFCDVAINGPYDGATEGQAVAERIAGNIGDQAFPGNAAVAADHPDDAAQRQRDAGHDPGAGALAVDQDRQDDGEARPQVVDLSLIHI